MIIDAVHSCLLADATDGSHHLESWYFVYTYLKYELPNAGYKKFVYILFYMQIL